MSIDRNQQLSRSDAAPDTKVYRTPLAHHPAQKHVKPLVGRCAAGHGDTVHTFKLTAQVQDTHLKRFAWHKQVLKAVHTRIDIGQSLAQSGKIRPLVKPVQTPVIAYVTPRFGHYETVWTAGRIHHGVQSVKHIQEHLSASVSHPGRYKGRYLYVLTAAVTVGELHGITLYERFTFTAFCVIYKFLYNVWCHIVVQK